MTNTPAPYTLPGDTFTDDQKTYMQEVLAVAGAVAKAALDDMEALASLRSITSHAKLAEQFSYDATTSFWFATNYTPNTKVALAMVAAINSLNEANTHSDLSDAITGYQTDHDEYFYFSPIGL
jgi:hypothetical protein